MLASKRNIRKQLLGAVTCDLVQVNIRYMSHEQTRTAKEQPIT